MSRLLPLGAVCFAEFEGSYLDFLQIAAQHRLAWVEFKHEPPLSERVGSRDTGAITRLADKLDIRLAVHVRFEGLNIASLDSRLRQDSLEAAVQSLAFARAIGADRMTVHSGELPAAQYSPEALTESWRNSVESLLHLASLAEGTGITLCVENSNGFARSKMKHTVAPFQLKRMRRQLQQRVAYTIDVGHAMFLGTDPTCLVKELGADTVGLCHLHDNGGERDEHGALGTGVLQLEKILRCYLAEGWRFPLNIEVKNLPDLVESVDNLNAILSALG